MPQAPSAPLPDPVRPGSRPALAAGRDEPHTGRRARVLERLGKGTMVLPASPVLYRSGDSDLAYRPDSELLYLTGWREPEAVAVLRGGRDEERFVLFVRPRDPEKERWDGPRMGADAAREWAGADAAYPIQELEARLPGLLKGSDRVLFRLGRNPRVEALVVESLHEARRRGARDGSGPRGVVDPGGILDPMRRTKDAYELALLRHAAGITAAGLEDARSALAPGMGEWEVQAILEEAFRRRGADGPGFGTIVGSGPNACVLHYRDNTRVMEKGDLVLIDCGAEYGDYSGDLTRTFPVSGAFTPAQKELWEVVDRARAAVIAGVRPGATLQGLHDLATRVLVEGMVEIGLLEGSVEGILEEKKQLAYFPHRTSHWLGLDVHDPGDHVTGAGDPLPLEPGMVFTVEPGLYVPAGSEGRAETWVGMGVRLEDDVVVTADGGEVLCAPSSSAPLSPASAP
jgi:Xaa-Pro aminopeptidase